MSDINPISKFGEWLVGYKNTNPLEPDACVLATANKDGTPSARVVLLKKFNEHGFYFFTNYLSRKARELKENPKASLCFYWMELKKQVRIEGSISQAEDKDSDLYFSTRLRSSQIGAWASVQSSVLSSHEELMDRFHEIEEKFKGEDIPRPPFWGGFVLKPERIEFWQEGKFRLHEREVFLKGKDGNWISKLLYP